MVVYDAHGSIYVLSEYSGSDKSVIIRSAYNSKPVREINSAAFCDSSVESVTLPCTLKEIYPIAFLRCNRLKEINIPDGTIKIDMHAFCDCASLKRVRLPDYVSLEAEAFKNCRSLETIDIPDTLIHIYHYCFRGDDRLQNIIVRFKKSDDWLGTIVRIFHSFGA